ncbi:MAG: metallo-beta-lactamase class B [Saprospiraceae bacterium]|jgi:metallo-beta-lactamase class B
MLSYLLIMNRKLAILIGALLMPLLSGCENKSISIVYNSDLLRITKVTDDVYIHTSYLATQNYGKVACNGMIVINGGQAIVCDTPTDNPATMELLEWISTDAFARIIAVVVTHFHVDCLGGLSSFHDIGIPSFANEHTRKLAREKGEVVPVNGFNDILELPVGDALLINAFHGAGHSMDNIVCYYEAEHVLFGGCLIKARGAGKGNLNDADVSKWSTTVENVKRTYPIVKVVIPGHGSLGGVDLLDYTIELFEL